MKALVIESRSQFAFARRSWGAIGSPPGWMIISPTDPEAPHRIRGYRFSDVVWLYGREGLSDKDLENIERFRLSLRPMLRIEPMLWINL